MDVDSHYADVKERIRSDKSYDVVEGSSERGVRLCLPLPLILCGFLRVSLSPSSSPCRCLVTETFVELLEEKGKVDVDSHHTDVKERIRSDKSYYVIDSSSERGVCVLVFLSLPSLSSCVCVSCCLSVLSLCLLLSLLATWLGPPLPTVL